MPDPTPTQKAVAAVAEQKERQGCLAGLLGVFRPTPPPPPTGLPSVHLSATPATITAPGPLLLALEAANVVRLRLFVDGVAQAEPQSAGPLPLNILPGTANKNYVYRLEGLNAAGAVVASSETTVTVDLAPIGPPEPAAPTVTISAVTGGTVTVTLGHLQPGDQLNWGDGVTVAAAASLSHTYASSGTRTVRIIRAGKPDVTASVTVTVTPPPQPIAWETVPAYSLNNGDVTFVGRNFRRTAPGPAFAVHANGGYDSPHRVIFENCIIRAKGSPIAGFRCRAKLKNVILIVDPPTEYGQSAARPIDFQEFVDLEMENVTIIGGGQILLSGKDGRFYGNAANGEGLKIRGFRFHNPDGRRSDGNRGYIKSNWGSTHQDNPLRIDNGGVIGWDVANWIQFRACPGMRLDVVGVEVLCSLGQARTEDTGSWYGGAGCSQEYPGMVRDCVLDTSGGVDWNYVPGVSASYDASNQVTLNATGYQNVGQTELSATAAIIGDAPREAYLDNSSHITLLRVVGIGARGIIGVNYGHDITIDTCQTHRMEKHWSGVPYAGYTDGFFQINHSAATGTTPNGPKQIYGAIKLINSVWGDKFHTGPDEPYTLDAAQLQGGGVSSGNIKTRPPADGGATLIRDLRARMAAEGITLGSTLPIPNDLPAGYVADVFAAYA